MTPSPAQPTPTVGNADVALLRMPSVVQMTGLGRSTIYRLMSEQRFPNPVRIGHRAVAWRRSELEAWSQACPVVSH